MSTTDPLSRKARTIRPGTLVCPAGCGRKRRVGHLACSICWRALPARRRHAVSAAWRAAQSDLTDERLWSEYMAERRVAVAALRVLADLARRGGDDE